MRRRDASTAFARHIASLETPLPPVFLVATTAHPSVRPGCATTEQFCCANRDCPIGSAVFRGTAAPPPTPAANRRATGAARSRRSARSARARNETEFCASHQPSTSLFSFYTNLRELFFAALPYE